MSPMPMHIPDNLPDARSQARGVRIRPRGLPNQEVPSA